MLETRTIEREGSVYVSTVVSSKQAIKEFLKNNSKFCAYLYYLVKRERQLGVPQFLLADDYSNLDDSKPGWVNFKISLYRIKSYCLEDGIEFLFVSIPTLMNLDQNYPYAELRRKVTETVIDSGIHFIDLFNSFAPFTPTDLWVNVENTHWNSKATTIAANDVVSYTRSHKLLEE